ncbi:MAG TPA: hypothetical protein VGU20_05200 [Stellaceae bacterium]|nr:hypothetical protein [Stellaceae bacterium]
MTETDKLVAAIFTASICAQSGANGPDEYLAQYEAFLEKMRERASRSPEVVIAKFGKDE